MSDELSDSRIGEGVHRVEYALNSLASLELCWNIYVDWNNWPKFHHAYGKLSWTKGIPWERGSTLSIEITQPIHINVEHIILKFVPMQRIAWIDHSGFVTVEQWVNFTPIPEGGTRVATWADIVGPPTIKDMLTLPLFKQFTKKWYNEFVSYCDGLAISARENSGAGDGDRTRDQRLGKP